MYSRGTQKPYVHFIGESAISVTQSCYLVRFKKYIILLDCGGYQESDIATNYKKNLELLKKIHVKDIDFVILHESHIDHTMLCPALYAKGCNAHLIVPKGTTPFLKLLWEDSMKVFTQDCNKLNKNGIKASPFYAQENIDKALERIIEVPIDVDYNIENDIILHYYGANHIINSCQIRLTLKDNYINHYLGFTGDIGPKEDSFFTVPRQTLPYCNLLLSENTYNDPKRRINKWYDRQKDLEKIVAVIENSYRVIIPCFSLQRTQVMLITLMNLGITNKIIVDSPLAQKICNIWPNELNEYLSKFSNIHFVSDWEESQKLINDGNKYIIISASGFLSGGRVLEWLKHDLSNNKNTILFCGYSGENNLASKIRYGDKWIAIDKVIVENKANIIELVSFSSHADYDSLINYLTNEVRCDKLALVHGDNQYKPAFVNVIQNKLIEQGKSTRVICTNKDQKIYF